MKEGDGFSNAGPFKLFVRVREWEDFMKVGVQFTDFSSKNHFHTMPCQYKQKLNRIGADADEKSYK